MNSAEEDIQATAMIRRSLGADTAYHFHKRVVLRAVGDLARLGEIAIGPFATTMAAPGFASLLTPEGHLDADMFVVPDQDGYWIDVHEEFVPSVIDRLGALPGVDWIGAAEDRGWRVFGELPDQKGAEAPFTTLRFADGRRRELGARVLRDAAEPEGLDWRHPRKWDGHAMKLGVLPDHRCVRGLAVTPEEAGFHRLGAARGAVSSRAPELARRVLPVRIEPRDAGLPPMAGAPVLAGDQPIGSMLDHEALYGLALITLEPWREALAEGRPITCHGEQVLVTWPTWLASESEGRRSPAAALI